MENTVKMYKNCPDYGHNLSQIDLSTQMNVAYDVESSNTQNMTYLESKKLWELKLQAKKEQYFNKFSLFWSKL